jgi:hypothetical protein
MPEGRGIPEVLMNPLYTHDYFENTARVRRQGGVKDVKALHDAMMQLFYDTWTIGNYNRLRQIMEGNRAAIMRAFQYEQDIIDRYTEAAEHIAKHYLGESALTQEIAWDLMCDHLGVIDDAIVHQQTLLAWL